jgi:hypothetical protein
MSLTNYSMFWQVDGGALNPMYDSFQDAPHKEAAVNVTGWSWQGKGPYQVTFVSKDAGGHTLGQRSVKLYVE